VAKTRMIPAVKLRILSFNWHEPYLCLLAETGHELFVLEPVISEGVIRQWDEKFRSKPENLKTISQVEMTEMLDRGAIDLIICHNVKDLLTVSGRQNPPKILVFHNKLTTEIALGGNTVDRNTYLEQIKPHLQGVHLVFISKSKKDDWGLEGDVIPPGIPAEEYSGYTGEIKTILRVGNRLMERDLMLGFSDQEKICSGLPTTILGDNPRLENSRQSQNWHDLKTHYQKCRVYLNTTKDAHEDGYNLSLLEAMATGMPIVTLANRTSPVTDGAEGFVSDSLEVLQKSANRLLEDPLLAKAMGEKARKTVMEKFPMNQFVSRWQRVIERAADDPDVRIKNNFVPLNIWIDYAYYPATTAHYLRRAFAKKYKVMTSGISMPQEVIKLWNLENMKAPLLGQDVPRLLARDAISIMGRFPADFNPDFFLWVETGLDGPPEGLEQLTIPKAAYFIDTHLHLDRHINIARMFDCVFLAQKEYIPEFVRRGVANVHWLPLACDPEIHGKRPLPKRYDIGFAGSITPSHQRRSRLLETLQRHFNVQVSRVFLEEMAELYSQSRIVFNNAIRNDLNMRVFEALCSGSLLLTDDAVGLSEFFGDGKHLAVYTDANIEEKAAYYLKNEEERERIAVAGMEEVLARHTYSHRADQIAETIRDMREAFRLAGEKPKGYFHNARPEVAELVPPGALRILEVGCAAGETGRMLKQMNPAREVVGLEFDGDAAKKAEKLLDRVFCADVERFVIPYPEGYFDCIVYADVLEHLRDPAAVIARHKRFLAPDGVMVMSIPNIRHVSVVAQLMEGRWTYQDEGILDRTHLRFFTLTEVREMLERCGMTVLLMQGKRADTVYQEGSKGTLKVGRWQIDNLTEEEMLEFFVFQYLLIAAPNSRAEERDNDPRDPYFFRKLIAGADVFRAQTDDAFTMTGSAIASLTTPEDARLSAAVASLEERLPERLLWVGHFNMAMGLFSQAREIYGRIGNDRFEGCAFAAQGLLLEALKKWWVARKDPRAAGWFERFSFADGAPEVSALSAVEEGNGARLLAGGAMELGNGLDYITSYHRLEEEGDPVRTLENFRDALVPGGVLAMACFSAGLDTGEMHKAPCHRFSEDGLKRLIGLVGGFGEVMVMELLPGHSFLTVCQKRGGAVFDYRKRLDSLLSGKAYLRSRYYWENKMTEAAAQAARAALSLDGDNADALSKLADCLFRQNDPTGAEELYKKAIGLSPSDAPYVGMGTLRLMKGDFGAAQEYFKSAAGMNPNNDRALCGMGMALFNAGNHEEGFRYYAKALAANPENGVALSSLIQAAYAVKDFTAAEEAVTGFLELHPANMDMLFGLAGLQYAQGKYAEARDALDRIALFDPTREDVRLLYEKLDEVMHAR